jgi:DNA-binding Lrp family transcriptional regulator
MSITEKRDVDLTDRQQRALRLIEQGGGIHQSDFWKEMDVSSRTGSRIITKLREKDLVEREETVYNGQNTYYISIVHRAEDLDFSLLMSGDMMSPFIGEEEIDPQSGSLTSWAMNLIEHGTNRQ